MKPIYLVKVEADENNNKFYRMIPDGDIFKVEYGRIGNEKFQTDQYPISKWNTQLRSKLRKGYIDQTHLVTELIQKKSKDYIDINVPSIAEIVHRLQVLAKQAIEENYTISSNKVTQKMIDEAQNIINNISVNLSVDKFNEKLMELFRVIPRKMKKVADNLATSKNQYSEIIQKEQDLLDTMRGQVIQQSTLNEDDESDNNKQTILDVLGLKFENVTDEEIKNIKKHLGSISSKYYNTWKVINNKTQNIFDKFIKENNIKEKKFLFHGSRSENFWSIINSGLLLRPNAAITGKLFGSGIYFASKAKKSLGYTSLSGSYWSNGNDEVGFMAVFDVAYGNPLHLYDNASGYGDMNYNKLISKNKNYNSLHAHEGAKYSYSNNLLNDEIIIYKEEQCTIKYLVELKN